MVTVSQDASPPQRGWLASIWAWVAFYIDVVRTAGVPILPFSPSPQWTPDQLGDQRGKVVFITGGNSGTGYQTAKEYYQHGATVYIGCRSTERATAAIANIKKGGDITLTGKWFYKAFDEAKAGSIEFIPLDLADLSSVEAAAAQFLAKEKKLDVLFANAGVMASDPGQYTKQDFALQFGTNVLGHQRLISLLLPTLRSTSKSNPTSPARLIVLASIAHVAAPSNGVPYDAITRGGRVLGRWAEYGASKWGDIALAKWVDARYGPGSGNTDDGEVISIAVHPGSVATDLGRHVGVTELKENAPFLVRCMFLIASKGALNQLWASATDVETARSLSGRYVGCFQTPALYRPDLDKTELVDKLWEYCTAQAERNE